MVTEMKEFTFYMEDTLLNEDGEGQVALYRFVYDKTKQVNSTLLGDGWITSAPNVTLSRFAWMEYWQDSYVANELPPDASKEDGDGYMLTIRMEVQR